MTKTFELDDKGEIANTTQINTTQMSPAKPKKLDANKQVDFYTALQAVDDGKRTATKQEWNDTAIIMKMVNETLCINCTDGKFDGIWHPFTLRKPDIDGKDWIVF